MDGNADDLLKAQISLLQGSDKERAVKSHLEYQNLIPLLCLFLACIIIHWVLLE